MRAGFDATVLRQIESEVRTIKAEYRGRVPEESIDSAADGIDVVDISSTTPRFVRTIDVAGAPNGLAVAEDTHRLYAGLIGGSVAVIDTDESSPKFMQMVDRVTVDSLAADLLDYSAQKQRVYVATGQSGEVVGIDTTTNQVKE